MEYQRLQYQLRFPHRFATGGVGPSPRPPDMLYVAQDSHNPLVLESDDRSILHAKGAGVSDEHKNAEAEISSVAPAAPTPSQPSPMDTSEGADLETESIDKESANAIAEKVSAAKSAAARGELQRLKVGHLNSGEQKGSGKRKPQSASNKSAKKCRITFN